MERKWGKWAGLAILVTFAIFSLFTYSYHSEDSVCKKLNVIVRDSAELKFVTMADVRNVIKAREMNPVGVTMKQLKPDEYEKMLKALPRIKMAQCYKSPNGTLNIEITQREPIIRIVNSGRGYYIDSEGKVMPLSEGFTAYVPVATGAITEHFAKNELYEFALFLKQNPFWDAQIEQINVDYGEEILLVPRVGDHIIKLGKMENFEYKLNKLMSVYQNGFTKTGWNKYRTIDLSYDNQVVCTKR